MDNQPQEPWLAFSCLRLLTPACRDNFTIIDFSCLTPDLLNLLGNPNVGSRIL